MSDESNAVFDFVRVPFDHFERRFEVINLAGPTQHVGMMEVGPSGRRNDFALLNETVAHMSVRVDRLCNRIERRLERVDTTL